MNSPLTRLNHKRLWIIFSLGIVLLIASSATYALTLNNAGGTWSNAVGGSGTPTCLVNTAVGTETQVRYGDDDFAAGCPASPGVQSGFGFDGNTTTTFANGQPFVLGELTHYNNQIFASSLLESVDLNLNVDLGDPVYAASLSTTVTLDETANNLVTCPYGGSQPCSDRVSINLPSTLFTVAGTNYQLEVLGLIPGTMGSCTYNANQIKGSFISAENAANSACIFGRLTPIDEAQLVITKDASVTQAHPGDIIDYQIDYNCFSTTTYCSAPNIVDYLPDEVIYTGSTGSTHTVGSSGVYSSTNNSVTFQFIDPLPAGSTGFVRIRVRVRDDGTVGNGQSINNLAVSTLGNGPTSTTTHSLPAIASSNWDVVKTAPAVVYLDTDRPTTDNVYTVGICSNGSDVNLQGATMVDTLPVNAVFVSASGGGVYTAGTPGTVTWNLGDLEASSGCTYQTVVVRYPNPPFTTAQNVTNTVDGSGTIIGGIPWTDTASVTNPLQQLVPVPGVNMSKSPGRSGYIVGARAQFLLSPRNTGNVSLAVFTVTDTLPAEIDLTQITVGSFDNYAGGVVVRYERSDSPGVWNVWPGGPFPNDNRSLNVSALGLPGGVYITKVQWDFGTVIPGFAPSGGGAGRIQLYGTVISPDHNGNLVTVGSVITNTATLDWQYIPSSGGPGTGGSSLGNASIDVDAIPNPVIDKTSAGGINPTSRFLIGQQVGYYALGFNNNTGISVDNFTMTDALPQQYNVTSITVGSYDNFTGGTVTIRYQSSNNPGVWNLWTGSPFTPANQTLNVSGLGLPGGAYITNLEWGYGTVAADFRTNAAPRINGVVINPDRNGAAVNNGSSMSNTAQLDWTYTGVPGTATDTQTDTVHKPVANPSVSKSTTTSGPYIPTSGVTYALRVGAASNSPSVLINPIVMELLPTNLNYVAGSWVYNAGGSGVPAPNFEQIADYNGTGRTLLRWRFTGNFPQNQFATITFNTTISAGASQGSLTNDYYVTSNDVDINGSITDVNDLDDDGLNDDTLIGASTTIPVDQLVGLDSFKGVRGELDSGYSVYPASGLTIPNGRVDYRLTIINRGNIAVNNVKVVDILPFVGDTGVQDTHPRNSAWRPVLTGPVSAPAGVTVYYSTSSNPCRPQIIPSGPAGCTAPNWTLLPPADITTVYSLRFDFSGNLAPGQSFVFNWTMKAPDNAPDGTIAWNSFAYTSTNANTGVPLRPAEPNKVGIEMSRPVVAPLIDLVKFTNDEDANLPTGPLIQVGDPVTWKYVITNTGNTRLANITLTDDVLGAITCTEGSIPALDPAASFTCTVTGTAAVGQYTNIGTVSGQPVDASDVPLTDMNGVDLPPVTDTDPSHYFGFMPALAQLGDYVWIDTNANGVQDSGEPGIGGVTVNLYQDGNPTAIATTATDGTGFYSFLNLAPDDYFVEFVIPSTYTLTAQDQGGDDTKDSDANPTTGRTAVTTLTSGENDPTWDAGVLPAASIGDYVWRDSDGNNVQNGVEPGVAGVQVDLLNSVGTIIATTFTDPAGFYGFTDLVPGDYSLKFTLPTGYIFSLQDQGGDDTTDSDADITTGRTVTTTLSPGENDPTWDAGLVQVSSIGDKVWRDNNNNGQQDSGEPGVSGVTVNLLDSTGTVIATRVTDANGNYLFDNLRNGDYAVQVVLPASGYVFSPQDVGNNNSDSDVNVTTGKTANFTLPPGKNDLTWDAGLVPLASIGDRVWNDANNNGQQDGGESGFAGVTVNLLDSGGAVIDTTTTDASGNYLFDELLPGDYAIQVVKPVGYVFSPRDNGADTSDSDVNRATGQTSNTTLSPGENDLTWDAGLVQDASIGNFVWSDTNDNGIQDGGEPGVSGVTVRLLDSSGNVVSTTVTDGTGFYLFDFLTPANYSLEFVAPTNYSMARRDQGGGDTTDSDPNRFTGRTIITTLSPGEDDLTWDAGLVLSASIGNYVWNDANQNGVQDGGESGISGVTVRLLDSTNTAVLTTTTNASGNYLFDPVPPDDYRVEVVLPAGYVFTLADQGGDDTTDSDVDIATGRMMLTTLSPDEDDMTWDAGVIVVASIGDKVWRDNDNDGVQDGGEPGVSGVTVRLLDSTGALVTSTTTDTNGNYRFNNLRPGTYAIQVVLPTGFQFSPQDAFAATDLIDSDVDISTGKTINTVLDPGETDNTWDAGLVPLASIGDLVWRDMNNNGRQDGGTETGVQNVTVNLLNSGGTVINTTTTDANGNYHFTNLPPGTYAVQFVLPAGFQFSPQDASAATDATDSDADTTTGMTINTLLDPGETDNTWDGGLVPLASIGDKVWQDTNGNGQQDGGESGVNNVTVHLLDSTGTVINTTTTDASGNYLFSSLPPGTYAIEFVLPGDYIFTTRDSGADATDSDPDRTTGRTLNTVLSPGENDLTWDAGIVQPASLGDYVWLDANDNGVQDDGMSGVANVTVRLLNGSGTLLNTTTTDSNGNYLFDNLIPGTYAVEFVAPSGYAIARLDQGGSDITDSDADRSTGRTITTSLTLGENDLTWDAGLVQVASIGDRVWLDKNNNGIQDDPTTEPGVSGVTVNLLNSVGTVINTTVTNSSGNYLFNNLTPADYAIQVVLPTGFQFSPTDQGADDGEDSDVNTGTGRTVNTTLGSDEHDLTWDAGLVPLASIGDRVWIDINNNGRQDSGELGLANVAVQLRDSGGALVTSTTTDTNGSYQFTLLPPADYSIQVVLPAGYQFSQRDAAIATDATDSDVDTTTGRTINTTLDPDEADMTWDAGVVPLAGIGNRVWIDINDNGLQDPGENGLSNVTVNLLDSSGALINTMVTDAGGNYFFSNLSPGTYAIEFVTPSGYVIAQRDQGSDDALDSDADLTTGRTINTLLDPAEADQTWDMGVVPVASIGDRVWIDMDNNGVQDGGENGLSGVTVRLLDSAGTVLSTKTTDASGNYLFDNLRPGDYAVQVVLPSGYQFSPQDAAAATDATDSDVDISTGKTIITTLTPGENDLTWDAGVVPLVSIGDRVWIDMDNNGVQDGGENGLSGVTVNLLNGGGTVISTQTTDASGNYQFTLLPPATYAIQVVLPAGYQFSPQDAAAATDATDSDVNITTGQTVNTTLTPGENDLTWDAGLVPLTSIGDTVWRDNDGDGVQDAAEPGVSGVTVRLLDSGGTLIATKVTDANGKYLFDLLPPADYSIQVVLPTGYIFSPQDAASGTDATDSDVNTTTGRTVNTTLIPDEHDLTWDAGLIPLGSIGDTVWIDLNGDAVVDPGETGIPNVKVSLLDSLGNVLATTMTDANGIYHFNNLPVGTYTVQIDPTTLPPKYGIAYDPDGIPDNQTTYTLGIGENVSTLDFGYWPLGSIGDTVWYDANHNGNQDTSEKGIPNVTLNLLDSLGSIIATTTTDSNGNYLFDNLPPATYTVEVDQTTLPPGLIQTGDPDSVLDSASTVILGPGEDIDTVDFGYAPPIPTVPAGAAVTPTLEPTPEVAANTPLQPFAPITACERECVNWQLYHTNQTGDWEIFRLGSLSDRPAVSPNLSQGEGADDVAPTRSPNAEWIVFSSNRDGNWELYVAPTDGDSSKTRRITHNTIAIDTDPVWGPNNYVVYETTRDGNWELYLIDMTTGVETRLTDNPADDINAYWSPDGTKLLFQSDRSGLWQIYEFDLRTGGVAKLSDGTANDVDPQYSNAGDRVSFRSYRDGAGKNSVIYVMDADGRNLMRVSDETGDATTQSWSPDDSLIAYQSTLDGDLDIYVYDMQTGRTRQMTDNDIPDYAPTWLCGTTQLIFTSDVGGNPDLFNADALPIEAPAIKVDKDAEQLTFDPADDIYPENSPTEENASREGRLPGTSETLGDQTDFLLPDFSNTEPDVSLEMSENWQSINSCATVCPTWTLFHSDRTGDGEIFRLDEGVTDANSLDLSLGDGSNDFGPTRAPNAQWIAFTSDRDGNNEIYVAASDGSTQIRLTSSAGNDTDPAWSPDSQRIVYESDRDGNWNLYIVDVQTGVEKRITDDAADDRNASWSSASGKIAFESNRTGTWQVYVYDLATSVTTQLTDSDENARSPVYGNGGSLIAFTLQKADGHTVIEVMQQDGTGIQQISDPAGNARNPAWYFDDTLLAYQSDLDGDLDIYVYDFASGQTRKLTDNGVDDYAPTWQCGKPAVTFTSDVTGNPDLFRADALPIDSAAVDVQAGADQLTQNPSSDRDPVGAPTEENASREE